MTARHRTTKSCHSVGAVRGPEARTLLTLLSIHNFATIDHVEVEFDAGLNALTGETGAGKSIVVDALSLLLGGRADPVVVRSGAERATVQGVFTLEEPVRGVLAKLLGRDSAKDLEEMILSRELNREGRSVARIDGQIVPLRTVRAVGEALVDIHGQGSHLSLYRVSEHLDILDRYGKTALLRARVATEIEELRSVRERLAALRSGERERSRRIDVLRYQIDEIRGAKLEAGEEEVLRTERDRLANAERLIELAESAYQDLYGDDDSATDRLGRVAVHIAELARFDPSSAPPSDSVEQALSLAEDLARTLRAYRDALEFDPGRLEAVESRFEEIERLKRKYGASVPEVTAFADDAERELAELEHGGIETKNLERRERELAMSAGQLALGLSQERAKAGAELPKGVLTELTALGIERARMEVAIHQAEALPGEGLACAGRSYAFDSSGIDRVEFLLSPNPGEALRPLARIASGGEAARVMLALKVILAEADQVPTLVFDEVDAGVGGRIGRVVGQKLWTVARRHQVICVSHLPQLAAYADRHLSVHKSLDGDRTQTNVALLGSDSRVLEIAAMLGASTKSGGHTAREMLETAAHWKAAGVQGSFDTKPT